MASVKKLHCIVCTEPIPEGRDRRQTATCSEKCKNQLDEFRAVQRAEKKCPLCLHPSTPEERAEFRLWRSERPKDGSSRLDVRQAVHEPRDGSTATRRALAGGLKQALDLVQEFFAHSEPLPGEEGAKARADVCDKVRGLRNLLAPPARKAIDSSPSGTAATEMNHDALG